MITKEDILIEANKIKFKRIGSGEYTFPGGYISKDEYESKLWWVGWDGFNTKEDVQTLRDAKALVIDQEENNQHKK